LLTYILIAFFIGGTLGKEISYRPDILFFQYLPIFLGFSLFLFLWTYRYRSISIRITWTSWFVFIFTAWGFKYHAPGVVEYTGIYRIVESSSLPSVWGYRLLKKQDTFSALGRGAVGDWVSCVYQPKFADDLLWTKAKIKPLLGRSYPHKLSWISTLRHQTLVLFHKHINRLSKTAQEFSALWLLGHQKGFETRIFMKTMKNFGIIHLFIVSGLHIHILGEFFRRFFLFPIWILYLLSFISPSRWAVFSRYSYFVASLVVLFYAYLVGQNVSVQRASLFFLVYSFCFAMLGKFPMKIRLQVVFFLQILFFPVGLLTKSTALSWLTMLFLINAYQNHPSSFLRFLWKSLLLQLKLCLIVTVLTHNFTPIGIIMNIILGIFFPFFYTGFFLFILWTPWLPDSFIGFTNRFIDHSMDYWQHLELKTVSGVFDLSLYPTILSIAWFLVFILLIQIFREYSVENITLLKNKKSSH